MRASGKRQIAPRAGILRHLVLLPAQATKQYYPDMEIHDPNFFKDMITPASLLAGFAFSAALQVMNSKQENKCSGLAALLLFLASFLFILETSQYACAIR